MKFCNECKTPVLDREYYLAEQNGDVLCLECGEEKLAHLGGKDYIDKDSYVIYGDENHNQENLVLFSKTQLDEEEIDDLLSHLKSEISYRNSFIKGIQKHV